MAKTLDPVWAAQKGKQEQFWADLFDALERALKLQLIVCPKSSVHEKETALSPQPEMIEALYAHFAQDVEFEYPTLILEAQLSAGFKAVLDSQIPDYDTVPKHTVVRGDPDRWLERVRLSVNLPPLGPPVDERREIRTQSHDAFATIFEEWGREKGKTFDHWYEEERRGHAETILILFRERQELLTKFAIGLVPLTEDVWNPRLEAGILPALAAIVEQTGIDSEEALRKAIEFLNSPESQDAPANDISALLMAALARKAAAGQKRPPSPGMWNDITAISSFLPYCDAMFIDDECAGLLREEPLRSKIDHGTKIFSNNNRDDFLDYFKELEIEAGSEHVTLVAEVYGDDWTKPFRTILEQERERAPESE